MATFHQGHNEIDTLIDVVPKSDIQIRSERHRRGLCLTCPLIHQPVQCYDVKRRFGLRHHVPRTVDGVVHKGICLNCQPSKDPVPPEQRKREAHRNRRRTSMQEPPARGHPVSTPLPPQDEARFHRMRSDPSCGSNANPRQALRTRGLERQSGSICLSDGFGIPRRGDGGGRRMEAARNLHGNRVGSSDRDADEIEDGPIRAASDSTLNRSFPVSDDTPHSPAEPQSSSLHNPPPQSPPRPSGNDARLLPEIHENEPYDNEGGTGGGQIDDSDHDSDEAAVDLFCGRQDDVSVITEGTFDTRVSIKDSQNPTRIPVNFKYADGTETYTTAESSQYASADRATNNHDSHPPSPPPAQLHDSHPPSPPPAELHEGEWGDSESHSTDLATLREFVTEFTVTGNDFCAIESVTAALMDDIDVASSRRDLALAAFCLSTLWCLARKSDENKRQIMEGETLDAIIEVMKTCSWVEEKSADVQTRGCGLLWSLSWEPDDRKNVVLAGGCSSILKAIESESKDKRVMVMALGALSTLSNDGDGWTEIRNLNGSLIVADAMLKHLKDETIQAEGCRVLCNLAAKTATGRVEKVSEKEVLTVAKAMLSHPDSAEVNEQACGAFYSYASLSANVVTIRASGHPLAAMELAINKHPDWKTTLQLMEKLGFDQLGGDQLRGSVMSV